MKEYTIDATEKKIGRVASEAAVAPVKEIASKSNDDDSDDSKDDMSEVLKTRIDTLDLSGRILNALTEAGIRTLGGLARKKKEDLLEIEGMGEKGIQEIKRVLTKHGITLK